MILINSSSMKSRKMRSVVLFHIMWTKHIFMHHKPKANMTRKTKPNSLQLQSSSSSSSGHDKDLLLIAAGGELSDGGKNVVLVVPKGCLAVYVGRELRRYVIPASYLSMPDFRNLMDKVAEELGYDHQQAGGLKIPNCDEDDFEDILARCFTKHQMMSKLTRKKKEYWVM